MKNFRIISLTVILSALTPYVFGQTVNKRTITVERVGTSESVVLNNTYTYKQFAMIMGTPDSKVTEEEEGELIRMRYGDNTLYLDINVFNCFSLVDGSYKLNGVVGVGDSVSKIDLLNPFRVVSEPNGMNERLYYAYITDAEWDVSPIYFYVQNRVIVEISYIDLQNS